jgi:hypothetical protein
VWANEIAMRWWIIALPFCMRATPDPGAMLPFELGALSYTFGHAIDPQMSDQTAAASEAGKCFVCLHLRGMDPMRRTQAL